MTPSEELAKLQNKRAGLEEESRLLEEKEKTLEERVKIVEESLAIQELEDRNQMKLNAVKELESKISELEKRLKKTPEEPETFTPTVEPPEQVTEIAQEEPIEGEVVVTEFQEPEMSQQLEQPFEDLKKQHEKKKRKLF